jgi:glutamine---fructose-6-phosphate transaminase (isomerizing)
MCGIVGYIGNKDAAPILMEGLARVEYRGYDSAGIALIGTKGLSVFKKKGKLRELESVLPKKLGGRIGIGHTRWATHGEPSDANAHPHVSGTVALIHNGIIENAAEFRTQLESTGLVFSSETDTEVLAHLVSVKRAEGHDLEDALRLTLATVEGTYGIAVIDTSQPDRIVVARNGSPVIVGIGEHEMLVGSDVSAMVRYTKQLYRSMMAKWPCSPQTVTAPLPLMPRQPVNVFWTSTGISSSWIVVAMRTLWPKKFTNSPLPSNGHSRAVSMIGSVRQSSVV